MWLPGVGQALFTNEKFIHSCSHLAPCTYSGTDAGTESSDDSGHSQLSGRDEESTHIHELMPAGESAHDRGTVLWELRGNRDNFGVWEKKGSWSPGDCRGVAGARGMSQAALQPLLPLSLS